MLGSELHLALEATPNGTHHIDPVRLTSVAAESTAIPALPAATTRGARKRRVEEISTCTFDEFISCLDSQRITELGTSWFMVYQDIQCSSFGIWIVNKNVHGVGICSSSAFPFSVNNSSKRNAGFW